MLLPNDDSHEYCFVFLKKNVGQSGGIPGLDLNVEDAWAQGFTGKGITTAIMDDGKNRSIHTVQMWIGLFLVHLKVNEKNPNQHPLLYTTNYLGVLKLNLFWVQFIPSMFGYQNTRRKRNDRVTNP